MGRKWSKQELDYLTKKKGRMTYRNIARVLHRSVRSIKMTTIRIDIANPKPRWTEKEEIKLRKLLQQYLSYTNIGRLMHRSRFSIASKARRLD